MCICRFLYAWDLIIYNNREGKNTKWKQIHFYGDLCRTVEIEIWVSKKKKPMQTTFDTKGDSPTFYKEYSDGTAELIDI